MKRLILEVGCFLGLTMVTLGLSHTVREQRTQIAQLVKERDQYVTDIESLVEKLDDCEMKKVELDHKEGEELEGLISSMEKHGLTLIIAPIEAKEKLRDPGYVTIDYRSLK